MLKKFVEVALEMIMQDREVQTEFAIQTTNLGSNIPTDSEFGIKIMMKN